MIPRHQQPQPRLAGPMSAMLRKLSPDMWLSLDMWLSNEYMCYAEEFVPWHVVIC
jgi:hypothetical protein